MAKAEDAQNPSMEQILQTIRGVISGEEAPATDGKEAPPAKKADNDDVLELTEMVGDDGAITSLKPETQEVSSGEEPAASKTPDVLASIDNALEEGTAEPEEVTEPTITEAAQETSQEADDSQASEPETSGSASEESAVSPETTEPTKGGKTHLISEEAADASTKALSTLLQNLPKKKIDGPAFRSGSTLEELVVEAIKPELAMWLDKNLPKLVTNIVEKEIRKLLPQPEE